ncbi:hypothetical protein NIES4072_33180 [Nostoc commune NIES-4072]|uniref:Uncharacterized protein n=1 Tax=Nostoc commune NIES-4072 TaxID=2005467 RepID=A0A2R5FNN0_NOSCO|nr:hypothetical protein NIES4072_33180 [Nostoc commune NIES-4072]
MNGSGVKKLPCLLSPQVFQVLPHSRSDCKKPTLVRGEAGEAGEAKTQRQPPFLPLLPLLASTKKFLNRAVLGVHLAVRPHYVFRLKIVQQLSSTGF